VITKSWRFLVLGFLESRAARCLALIVLHPTLYVILMRELVVVDIAVAVVAALGVVSGLSL
jgi:hypothetical protein